jgi:hypothetical protein
MRFELLSPVRIVVSCTSCTRPVELELEGTLGVAGYDTFNPFHCPHCRKLNQPRTAGHILAVRAIASA